MPVIFGLTSAASTILEVTDLLLLVCRLPASDSYFMSLLATATVNDTIVHVVHSAQKIDKKISPTIMRDPFQSCCNHAINAIVQRSNLGRARCLSVGHIS